MVKVEEPTKRLRSLMLRGVAGMLEKHHQVQILDEAIETRGQALASLHPGRQLPDKAVSLLDTACARVAISQHARPAEVEDCMRRRQALEIEQAIIGREGAIGMDVGDREARVEGSLGETDTALAAAQARWDRKRKSSRKSWSCAPGCAGRACRSMRSQGEDAEAAPPAEAAAPPGRQ